MPSQAGGNAKPTTKIDFFAALLTKSNAAQDGKQSKKKEKKAIAPAADQAQASTKLTKYSAYSDASAKKRKKPTSLKKKILNVSPQADQMPVLLH